MILGKLHWALLRTNGPSSATVLMSVSTLPNAASMRLSLPAWRASEGG